MATQSQKYSLAMAGEFFVTAQLQRLGAAASVTYGNAKRADVVVISHSNATAVVIEVKTSSSERWVIGSRVPQPSDQIWVFVHLPDRSELPPEFYIVQQSDIHELFMPDEIAYRDRYKTRHGTEFGDKKGVAVAKREKLEPYKDKWNTVLSRLQGLPSG